MKKRLVILGAGESGVGAAVLGLKQGYEVFVSDKSKMTVKSHRFPLETPRAMSLRKLTIALAPFLLASCARRAPAERFTHTDPQNPYIMFDQKTAQSCWAGPAEAHADIR